MKRRPNRDVAGDVGRLKELVDQRHLDEALELAEKLQAEANSLGVASAFITWHLAVIHDLQGNLEKAFELISTAMDLDPFATPLMHSYEVIRNRMRAALADPEVDVAHPQTVRLWEQLSRTPEIGDACHLVLARHHLARGNLVEALRVTDAITTLRPFLREAWLLKAEIARRLNDPLLADKARFEAAALEGEAVPFVIPCQVQG